MTDQSKDKVYLVTGVWVAIDSDDGILIAGMLSENPFMNNEQESASRGSCRLG